MASFFKVGRSEYQLWQQYHLLGYRFWNHVLSKTKEASEDIGLSDIEEFPEGYLGQLASPFQWKKING